MRIKAPARTPMASPGMVTKLSGEMPTVRSNTSDDAVTVKLCIDEQGHVTALYIGVSGDLDEEWGLRQIVQHPNACIETDAFALGRGKPHPALHGAFPRVLGEYVREQRLITLEDAVRRMTSLSAERFHLEGRGLVREGYWADLTVFDPETIADRTTYLEPEAAPAEKLVGPLMTEAAQLPPERRALLASDLSANLAEQGVLAAIVRSSISRLSPP